MIWALVILIVGATGGLQSVTVPMASEAHCTAALAELRGRKPDWVVVCGARPLDPRGVAL